MRIAAGGGAEDGGRGAAALDGVLLGGEGEFLEFVGGGDGGVKETQPERALEDDFEAGEFVVDAGAFEEVEEVGCAEVAGDGESAQ
ncbi:MAG: hypothetical protein KIS87_02155 [Phycisphaeraceae bacterium]|nr:hypothetical protein [Phycisphaeraceae bacterium]